MSPRAWPDRIRDILESIEETQSFVEGMSFEEFAADPKTLKAVLANFAIIGEGSVHIPNEVTDAHADVPWKAMRDMRNIVVHVYFGVEPAIVWDTIQNDLPKLIGQLIEILDSQGT